MAANPRRRNRRAHVAILDATFDQLTSVGYVRMTIEGIAAQAGVGKATVYRWWPSKARLVVEALSSRGAIEPVRPTGELRSDLRAIVRRAIEFMTKAPLGRTLPHLAGDFAADPQARADLIDWLGPARASHIALLYEAAGRGELPHDLDANLVLDLIAGTVMYRSFLDRCPDDHLVDQLTRFVIDRHLPRAGPDEGRLV